MMAKKIRIFIFRSSSYCKKRFPIVSGVAEELCRLFQQDDSIDMTPILRRSKDSARHQRSKPEEERDRAVPTSKPLTGMQFGPPRAAPERSRKRHFPEPEYYTRPKMPRGPVGRPPPVSRYATGGSSSRSSSSRSYEEYLRNVRPSGYGYPAHYPPQQRSGYSDFRGSYDSYGYGGRGGSPPHDRRAYDRSVEEFLRRTSASSSSSHSDRRYDRR